MIKQIPSKKITDYLKKNPKCVLLDVRTKEEWDTIGKPNGEKIGLKTYFLSIQFGNERIFNENFIQEFKNLNIGQDHEILIMCRSGGRSQAAAELLTRENYTCSNISDGFEGNQNHPKYLRRNVICHVNKRFKR